MISRRFKSSYIRLLALWVLRAFAPGLGRTSFLNNSTYSDPDIAEFLGLPDGLDAAKVAAIPRLLEDLQISLEAAGPACLPALARGNFAKLAVALKLNTTEQRVIEFFVCVEIEPPLADTCRVLGSIIGSEPSRFVSRVLGLSRNAVSKALAPRGRLVKCGLLKRCSHPMKRGNLEFHSDELARQLLQDAYDPSKLLKAFGVVTPAPPELGLDDFPHLQASLDLLLPYLRKVRSMHKHGVNVLVHGEPGTGKTQLVRVLGRTLGIVVECLPDC